MTETLSLLVVLHVGNPPVDFPHEGPVMLGFGVFAISLIKHLNK